MWDNVVEAVVNDNDWMREAKDDADNVVDARDSMKNIHSLAQQSHKVRDDAEGEVPDVKEEKDDAEEKETEPAEEKAAKKPKKVPSE